MNPWNDALGLFSISLPFVVGVITSIVCGGIVGLERQLKGKAVGVRTSILICMATMIFVQLSMTLSGPGPQADPTRVLGQVVTGVGFLGAGVIMSRGDAITGVTSAAVVWMLAAIGSTIGAGRPAEALSLSFIVVGVLTGMRLLERAFRRLQFGESDDDREADDN